MNTESVNFIKDHVLLLQEKYNESLAKINEADIKGEDSSFYKGQNFAYYDALELIKSQVEAFGYNSKEVPVAVPEFGKPATLDAITQSFKSLGLRSSAGDDFKLKNNQHTS